MWVLSSPIVMQQCRVFLAATPPPAQKGGGSKRAALPGPSRGPHVGKEVSAKWHCPGPRGCFFGRGCVNRDSRGTQHGDVRGLKKSGVCGERGGGGGHHIIEEHLHGSAG